MTLLQISTCTSIRTSRQPSYDSNPAEQGAFLPSFLPSFHRRPPTHLLHARVHLRRAVRARHAGDGVEEKVLARGHEPVEQLLLVDQHCVYHVCVGCGDGWSEQSYSSCCWCCPRPNLRAPRSAIPANHSYLFPQRHGSSQLSNKDKQTKDAPERVKNSPEGGRLS